MNLIHPPTVDKPQLPKDAVKPIENALKPDIAKMSSDDIQALIHNLETHQIELEMQNEELRKIQEELTKTRNEYAELYDVAPVGYLTLSKNSVILKFNLTFEKMLEIPRSNLLNKPLSDFIIDEDQDIYYKCRLMIHETHKVHSCELRLRHQSGTPFWVRLESVCVDTPDDECAQVRVALSNITSRKYAEERQLHLERELQQAQKTEALGQLTGGIAHDFNNVLGIILGNTELALNHSVPDDQSDTHTYLQRIHKAGLRAKNLIIRMLAFSRSQVILDKPIQIEYLIKEDLKLLLSILPSSIKIITEFEHNIPAILMDPIQLNQLLMNLCINSRDAINGQGQIILRLSYTKNIEGVCAVCQAHVSNDWVELSITDSGSGIDPALVERIFNPYFTTKNVGKGTGMGLSVVQKIVRSHGGHILVNTTPGTGTTFRLLFPPILDVERSEHLYDQSSASELPHGQGQHIMVVDDEPSLAELIGSLLQFHGYKTTVLTSGEAAMDVFEANPGIFALLLTDQTMPEVTGLELIKIFRSVRPDLPVILSTGFSEDINAESATTLNIHYLEKPVDSIGLLRLLGELLGNTA